MKNVCFIYKEILTIFCCNLIFSHQNQEVAKENRIQPCKGNQIKQFFFTAEENFLLLNPLFMNNM